MHTITIKNFQLIGLLLSYGQIYDLECAVKRLSKINLDRKKVLEDKAFCSAHIRDFIQA